MKHNPDICIIAVPYDSGHRSLRMGGGPEHLLENGLSEALQSRDRKVRSATVHPGGHLRVEVATAFELDRLVSAEVRAALAAGEFPLVLSGNCNSSVGTLSGVGPEELGIVWFDAHADFNTPETTTTGFTDGMGLAIAVAACGIASYDPALDADGQVLHAALAGARVLTSPVAGSTG